MVSLSADLTAPAASKMAGSGKVLLDNALLPASTNGQGGSASATTISGSGSGSPQAFSVYSQTAHIWRVSSGAFADVVTVTVTY
jgi:spore coat protein U-like protein